MELKLARAELNKAPKSISLEEIEKLVNKNGQEIFYFDRENSQKDMQSLIKFFEKKGLSVYHIVIKYGLSDDEYMYEVHII